ncbi:MAG: helix-hairpin-helix domain-containing protein, partial [Lachnospiraceae bacterium]|nr:helix-hairpin-helix domain-containing protein [Lachnospiraceae bacterium]
EETGTGDEKLLCVYVCGEVNASGVYYLYEGSRIFDALQMAGGMTEEADESAINLAGFLKDGDMLYFPKKGEVSRVAGTEDSGFKDSRVNINTGTEKDLMTLPGIGESRAKDIIAYREQNGFFTDVKDIMKVSGIKDSVYNKIKDLIRVD